MYRNRPISVGIVDTTLIETLFSMTPPPESMAVSMTSKVCTTSTACVALW